MKKYLIGVLFAGFIFYLNRTLRNVQGSEVKKKPKNVVIILADDIGYNDVSFHGSNEMATYNIDALAYNGVIMDRFYVTPLCTPSRASLMTGKYHHRIGMQHHVIWHDSPFGLGLEHKLMPQYFKDAGYSTHLVGKWHLGHYQPKYWPQRRGFDTFFGYLGAYIDYFDHSVSMLQRNYSRGHDLRRDFEDVREYDGQYATDVFTKEAIKIIENHDNKKPLFLLVSHLAIHSADERAHKHLQPKEEDLKKFSYIKNEKRRKLAAMLHSLDQSVGEVVNALDKNGLLDDTIITFLSDNGGPTVNEEVHPTGASNYPLRGEKAFAWEGGIRVPGVIYAPFLLSGVIRKNFFQITDFIPTLKSLANADYKIEENIDGLDLSKMVKTDERPYRNEVEVFEDFYGISSLILDGFKIVNGTALEKRADGWLGTNDHPNLNNEKYFDEVLNSKVAKSLKKFSSGLRELDMKKMREEVRVKCLGIKTKCDPDEAPCLFDIINDPCEENNLAKNHPELLKEMWTEVERRAKFVQKSIYIASDPRGNPDLYGGSFNWWIPDDEENVKSEL